MESGADRTREGVRLLGSRGSPGRAARSWSLPTTASARLRLAGRCIAVALACGMLLSPELWTTRPDGASLATSFPMVAPAPGLEVLAPPEPFDAALYAGTLALCALAAVRPRRLAFGALFAACLLLALPDMLRWQPWYYLYTAGIGVLAFIPQGTAGEATRGRVGRLGTLWVLRLMVASLYFYSGANKLNAAFLGEKMAGFLAGMPHLVSESPVAAALTYSAPGLEMAAGLGLILGGIRVRHAALALAASTNLLVLVALMSGASNVVVWPWNVAMIVLTTVLFAGHEREVAPVRQGPPRDAGPPTRLPRCLPGSIYAAVVVVLFAVMPAAGVLGYWPSYLSFALYSENTIEASVNMPGHRGWASVRQVSYERLNVPAYPSQEMYEAVGEQACEAEQPSSPALVVWGAPEVLSGSRDDREYTCCELEP